MGGASPQADVWVTRGRDGVSRDASPASWALGAPPLGAVFRVDEGIGHSSRSAPGWLWTDLDEYASDAPVMHAVHVVLTKKRTFEDMNLALKNF